MDFYCILSIFFKVAVTNIRDITQTHATTFGSLIMTNARNGGKWRLKLNNPFKYDNFKNIFYPLDIK